MNLILAVFIGGGLGSLCRYGLSEWARTWDLPFPIGTFLSNVIACAILAIAIGVWHDKLVNQTFLPVFIIVGFCGGFSTFSTFSFETYHLIKTGYLWVAILNVLLSVFTCILIFWWLIKKS